MNKFITNAATLAAACILVAACAGGTNTLNIDHFTDEEVEIFPDYKDVTIPPNIAPLNFQTSVPSATRLLIEGTATSLMLKAKDGVFDIPMKQWKQLLSENRGGELRLTVCRQSEGRWEAFRPFCITIAHEPIDDYLVYRLVQPGYKYWHHMGIYQRRLETYEQTPVYENRLTQYNCVNCHSFANRQPETMLLHMRAANAGTILLKGDTLKKLNPSTDGSTPSLVYPSWHPSGNYVAMSTNDTRQAFFMHNENVLEVFDVASDVFIYDAVRDELFTTPLLSSDASFETFPTFSPDGRSLYFCTASAVEDLPLTYKQVKYSLCRIDVDVDSRTFGTTVDTLGNAHKAFVLPQKNPAKHYADLFYSYNIPELVTGKVTVNPQHIARLMRSTSGTDVTLSR